MLRTRDDFRELLQFTPTGRCYLVGHSVRPEHNAMRSDAATLAGIGAGILLLGVVLAWWIASRVTRPLVEIIRTAKQVAAGDLSERITLTEPKMNSAKSPKC